MQQPNPHLPMLKFAVVREDANLEAALVKQTDAQDVLVVASGGCTALTLLAQFPTLRVTAFDLNPVQLEHVRAKARAVEHREWKQLNIDDDSKAGLNQRGTFEGLFRTLRCFLEEFVVAEGDFAAFFSPEKSVQERAALVQQWQQSPYWNVAFELCFNDGFLCAMFGPEATQHAAPASYPAYFRRAFESALTRADAHDSPFLQHVFLGKYHSKNAPVYLRQAQSVTDRLELIQGTLLDVVSLERFGVISLSNVFDWSDDALVVQWAHHLTRRARPGALLLIRQLNNRRDVQRAFEPHWRFDHQQGRTLLAMDRSFFYERILVAVRHT